MIAAALHTSKEKRNSEPPDISFATQFDVSPKLGIQSVAVLFVARTQTQTV